MRPTACARSRRRWPGAWASTSASTTPSPRADFAEGWQAFRSGRKPRLRRMSDSPARSLEAWTAIGMRAAAPGGILIVADHASNHVPADIDLGIDPRDVLDPPCRDRHRRRAAGRGAVRRARLRRRSSAACRGWSATSIASEDAPGLVPGRERRHRDPRQSRSTRPARAARRRRASSGPIMPRSPRRSRGSGRRCWSRCTASRRGSRRRPEERRPWQIGILYNRTSAPRGSRSRCSSAAGIVTGDNEPYSGRVLNATMNRHGEASGPALSRHRGAAGSDRRRRTASRAGRTLLAPVIGATWDSLARATAAGMTPRDALA